MMPGGEGCAPTTMGTGTVSSISGLLALTIALGVLMAHEIVVYGPVAEGEKTISGGTYPMSGYGWCCTCKQSGFGYADEDEADHYASAHIDGTEHG